MIDYVQLPLLDGEQIEDLETIMGVQGFASFLSLFAQELTQRPAAILALYAQGDAGAAGHTAHYLKGAALNVGASRIAALLSAIESAPEMALPALMTDLPRIVAATDCPVRDLLALIDSDMPIERRAAA